MIRSLYVEKGRWITRADSLREPSCLKDLRIVQSLGSSLEQKRNMIFSVYKRIRFSLFSTSCWIPYWDMYTRDQSTFLSEVSAAGDIIGI
ncbi:hypothetical protein FRX31_013756 [Thalictrum thalictroides]|uniref:Uncharacterized protein n=1 Tax=Thalictrum thalictroides TaxID=46969 RepID=A0A7J6WGU1_THATH|nr:hypothetical protein FRX31_013756 [Thalictrum thalictroides]